LTPSAPVLAETLCGRDEVVGALLLLADAPGEVIVAILDLAAILGGAQLVEHLFTLEFALDARAVLAVLLLDDGANGAFRLLDRKAVL
jgi:hypothetical protein